jgi:hypothetical protein
MRSTVEPIRNPFTILVDTAESQPWTFQGLHADADKGGAPLFIPWRYSALGRHPNSLGDYSIDGLVGRVAIERKAMEDCISTVLGWTSDYQIERGINGRRERFKQELSNLHNLDAAIVIVEATFGDCLRNMPGCDGFAYGTGSYGVKSVRENRKTFSRSIASWTNRPRDGEPDLRVQWHWAGSRREAEAYAFRWLEKYWEHLGKEERKAVAVTYCDSLTPLAPRAEEA